VAVQGRTATAPTAAAEATTRAHQRATLSVAVMTAGPGARVTATLELLRPLAHEIIVAVDDRAPADVVEDVATVADRVVLYPFLDPVDRPLPWLFHECRSDWMLTLDDDEVPSVALLEALPSLLDDDRIVHYSLSRRWVYPDTGSYLDDEPWQPDYQPRLFRTDPRLIRFSDELHRPIVPRGPGRFVREPIWHLDAILRTREERRAKADRYEAMRPGMRASARALNYAFYVPESRPDARRSAVPGEERTLLELLLTAGRPASQARVEPGRVTREEIDARWPADRTRQSGELQLLQVPPSFAVEEERAVDVRVRNTSAHPWQWGRASLPTVRCAAWWDDDDLATAIWTPLPSPVAPGESVVVPVHVRAPSTPGSHRLHVDLVHEDVRWLGLDAVCTVVVRPRRRIAFLDPDPASIRDALAREPEVEPVVIGGGPGYGAAPSPAGFLLAQTRWLPAVFAVRAARFLLAVHSGAPLPRGGRAFLDVIASCDQLVVGASVAATRRERWTRTLILAAARLLHVPVTGGT
jgi:hypothetical protein